MKGSFLQSTSIQPYRLRLYTCASGGAFKQESDNMIQKLDAGLKSVDNWTPMPAH